MNHNQIILQHAYLVPDIDAAIQHWHKVFGLGPFFLTRHIELDSCTFKGAPSSLDFSVAIAQSGDAQVELVQQHCDSPSCFQSMKQAGRFGLHHIAVFADDYDALLADYASHDILAVTAGTFGGSRFAYVDATATLGLYIEVLEENKNIRKFFDFIKATADNPDHNTQAIYTSSAS